MKMYAAVKAPTSFMKNRSACRNMNVLAALLVSTVMILSATSPVMASSNAVAVVNVGNTAPVILSLGLEPDDDPTEPGVQIINPDPEENKTVTLTVIVSDKNGYYDISEVTAEFEGPDFINQVVLMMNRSINISTSEYKGEFNLSNHKEGEYKVIVRAKDKEGLESSAEMNFTYSYALPAVNFTLYDFSEGAGEDKWAYRKQHDEKPPRRNDVPNIGFNRLRYGMISEDDGVMAIDSTNRDGNYAIHRFKFNIKERVSDIVRIEVMWNGVGAHLIDERGATLYVWNFSSGAYDEIDRSTDVFLTLRGNITEHIGDYIDDDGTFIVAVEQNAPQSRFLWFTFRSYIATDYISVNVSYIPRTMLRISDALPTAIVVRPGADIRFDINVTNEGAPGSGYVNGTVIYPNGTRCDIGWIQTKHMETGESSVVHLYWTVPDNAPAGIYGFIASSWDSCCNEGCEGLQDEFYLSEAFIVVRW